MRRPRLFPALALACCASAAFCTSDSVAMAEDAVATTGGTNGEGENTGKGNVPAAEYLPGAELTPILAKADERYAQAMARIDLQSHKRKTDEYETRLNSYQRELARVTKAGDFETAQKIKKAIDAIEDPSLARAMKPKEGEKPEGAVKFKGHWYLMVNDKCTWHVARRKCEEMGGHLVCVETADEAKLLIGTIAASDNAWIGSCDSLNDNEWIWLTGEKVELPQIGRLETFDGREALSCSTGPRQFYRINSMNRIRFICEWDQ